LIGLDGRARLANAHGWSGWLEERRHARNDREILVPAVREAIGLALDLPRGLVYYTSAVGDVGRARLDGSEAESLLADGGAFTGIAIADVP
jgi:hypothetical protein